jgi:hypothetical protein
MTLYVIVDQEPDELDSGAYVHQIYSYDGDICAFTRREDAILELAIMAADHYDITHLTIAQAELMPTDIFSQELAAWKVCAACDEMVYAPTEVCRLCGAVICDHCADMSDTCTCKPCADQAVN